MSDYTAVSQVPDQVSSPPVTIPFEEIRYLSRSRIHHPGIPQVELADDRPEVAIRNVIDDQWKKACIWDDKHFQMEDDRPYTLNGQLYARLLTAPNSTSTVWNYEVPYPADSRIESVMEAFVPVGQRDENQEDLRTAFAASTTSAAGVGNSAAAAFASHSASFNGSVNTSPRERSTSDATHSVLVEEGEISETMDGSSEDELEYWPPNCSMCGRPAHERVDQCSQWKLPSRTAEEESTIPETTPVTGTPTRPITGFFNPDGTFAPNAYFWSTHDDTVLHNFQVVLGLDPYASGDLVRLRELAREHQDQEEHRLYAEERRLRSQPQFDQRRESQPAELRHDSREAAPLLMGLERDESRDRESANNGPTGQASDYEQGSVRKNSSVTAVTSRDSSLNSLSTKTILTTAPSLTPTDVASISGSPVTERIAIHHSEFQLEKPEPLFTNVVDAAPSGFGIPLPSSPHGTNNSDESMDTQGFLEAVSESVGPPLTQSIDGYDDIMGTELFHWAEEQMARQAFSRDWDIRFTGSPLLSAHQLIWGPLRSFLDFPRMATDNLRDMNRNLSTYNALFDESSSSGGDTDPSEDVWAPPSPSNSNAPEPNAKEEREVERERRRMEEVQALNALANAFALKATRLLEDNVIGNLASVRYGLLEGSRRLESLLVREKVDFRDARHNFFRENDWLVDGANPSHFVTCRRPQHPLLFDLETAQLHIILAMLKRRGDISWVLQDLLRIQFLDNYAIKRLLAAGFLDRPEIDTSVSDPESSSSDEGPGYPGGLAAPAAGAATAAAGASSVVGEGIFGSTSSRTSSPNPASFDDGQRGESSSRTDNAFIFRGHDGDR
ncbi:hypothetical protein C8F04DRAFT_1283793 [Mycena alexandri]|uniref:Uncharacterized protein n=1 Tax=Mycena alexandri TaxID=1745969 RepID=A0AAD6RVE0_9AGAR|nr:hypothetical protein C8F04DRAFT_1283793 [Mycena alexandri]